MSLIVGGMRGGGVWMSGGGAAQSYSQIVRGIAPSSLLAHWRLNEGAGLVAFDSSGAGRHGAYSAGVVVGNELFLDGYPAPVLDGDDAVNIYSTSLRDAFSGAEGSVSLWVKPASLAVWTNATTEYLLALFVDGNNQLEVTKPSSTARAVRSGYKAGGTSETLWNHPFITAAWYHVLVTWSKTNERVRLYINGRASSTHQSDTLGTWVGNLSSTSTALGAVTSTGSMGMRGALAHGAIWDTELTAAQALALVSPLLTDRGLFIVGDSKSTTSYAWPQQLTGRLNELGPYNYVESPARFAVGGYTAATMHTYIDANLAAASGTAHTVTINLGANDADNPMVEATWKADLVGIIDPIRAKWPSAKIYIAKPWRQNFDTECDTLAGWIDDVIATYASGVYDGPDERTWLEGGDDGATYTTDGIHYSAAGVIECASQWRTAIGANP